MEYASTVGMILACTTVLPDISLLCHTGEQQNSGHDVLFLTCGSCNFSAGERGAAGSSCGTPGKAAVVAANNPGHTGISRLPAAKQRQESGEAAASPVLTLVQRQPHWYGACSMQHRLARQHACAPLYPSNVVAVLGSDGRELWQCWRRSGEQRQRGRCTQRRTMWQCRCGDGEHGGSAGEAAGKPAGEQGSLQRSGEGSGEAQVNPCLRRRGTP